MKISRKQIVQATFLFAATVFFSSCNRGYGCPNDFGLNENVIEAVNTVVSIIC
ncbi:MAG: hypothetical protein AAGJ82_07630 [Bacteroidota bacterium]